jgi:DNA-binding CsgD family transcriptional regulator
VGRTSRKTQVILSPAEQAVFNEIVKYAYDNDQIAERLGITRRTAKFHVSNLLRKFQVISREKLILLYWQERYRALQKQQRAKAR